MGGIKNKLNKLSNKTIPLSDSRLTSPFSQRGTIEDKQSLPLGKGRQMSVAHRWGRYTKYLSIACLSLAILSTLILNIVSSYSSSNIESNAIDSNSELSTLANDSSICNPTNTNAAACISLSITPLTTPTSSPCDTSNSNICMEIPDDGGIATGGHTIKVSSNSYAGYNVLLSASEANNDETSLVNTTNGSSSIPTTIGNLTTPSKLDNNTWGYTLANPTGQEANAIWTGLQPSTNKTAIATAGSLSNQTDSYPVYYGVKVDNPSQLLAGDYQTQVVYTATVNSVEPPAISAIEPSQIETPTNGQSLAIGGSNLLSTYDITLYDQNNNSYNCTDIAITDDTKVSCTLPNLPVGKYDLVLTTQGGQIGDGVEVVEPHEPVFGDIAYMQDMTPALCASALEGDTTRLVDKRDGKKYWVAKLADGNCWMTQNLELDLSGRTLTPADSDVSSNWTYNGGWYNSADQGSTSSTAIQGWNLGNYVWTSPDTYDGCGNITGNLSSCSNRFTEVSNMTPMTKARTDGVVIEGNTYDAHYKTGYYYSWNAATAGSGIGITNRYAASSICPLGWELPANSATFNTLRKQYDASGLLTGDDITTRTPLYFALSGMAFPSTASSNLYGAGDNGYYWSSEAYVFEGIAKGMHLNTYGPENDDRQSRDVGGSIRCVAAR